MIYYNGKETIPITIEKNCIRRSGHHFSISIGITNKDRNMYLIKSNPHLPIIILYLSQ